ncbi:MAG TPA: cytochrome c family protein [Alphaproteobacteria bacterium]|nr:cytochrome c family protein [Alphaproteobacteria bacterium]
MRKRIALLTAALTVAAAAQAMAQDKAKQGESVFKRTCAACHTVEAGKNKVGPSLAGVVGRKAASAEGFKYSEPMMKSGLTWTEENLDKYLADPKGFIPGNKMAFVGVKKEDERQAVIDYLETVKAGS